MIPMVQLCKLVDETVKSDAAGHVYGRGSGLGKTPGSARRLVKDQLIEIILLA